MNKYEYVTQYCDFVEVKDYVTNALMNDVTLLYKGKLISGEHKTVTDVIQSVTEQYFDFVTMQENFKFDDAYAQVEVMELKYFINDCLNILEIEFIEAV